MRRRVEYVSIMECGNLARVKFQTNLCQIMLKILSVEKFYFFWFSFNRKMKGDETYFQYSSYPLKICTFVLRFLISTIFFKFISIIWWMLWAYKYNISQWKIFLPYFFEWGFYLFHFLGFVDKKKWFPIVDGWFVNL